MNTTQPLNKILFLLDEISACKQRLSMATNVTRDIEIAVLQAKTIELYTEIQQYNRQALQPSNTQIPVNHYQAALLKESPKSKTESDSSQKEPWPFDTPAPKQETAPVTKPEPVSEKLAPLTQNPQNPVEAPNAANEAGQSTEKQPKPIHPRPVNQAPVNMPFHDEQNQQQTPRKDTGGFEKKREKLLREEEENKISEPVVNQHKPQTPVQETKQPEPVQPKPEIQKPTEEKPAPAREAIPQQQVEVKNTAPIQQQQASQQVQPETQKQSISQLYAQSKEKSAAAGTEKSLNEKLATQQTSLNDKFQSNVKKNLADKLKLSPISDLKTAININQRVAFINQLFKGDDKEFKNVVSTVNGFKNFSEAKFFLQSDIAPRYSWNEQDENVQEFMELVYRKFL